MNLAGILSAVLAALFMGTIGVFSRKTGLPPEVITFFRLFFGAGFLALYLLATGRLHLLLRRPTWPILLNGLMLAGFIVFYIEAMNLTTMANAIMLLYLAPLAAAVVAHFFLGERLSISGAVLIATALLGFAMMMEFRVDFSGGAEHGKGLMFAAAGLSCYAAFILINRTIDSAIDCYNRTFYQLMAGALCMTPLLASDVVPISATHWLWLAGAGFFPGFLAIYLAVVALDKLPAATFGTLAYLEPIFVVFLGWVLFAEKLNTLQLCGCALILASGVIKGYLAGRPAKALR